MISSVLQESGPLGMLTLLAGVIALPIAFFVPLVIGLFRWKVPASLGWVGVTFALLLGAGGTAYGVSLTHEAAAHAAPEHVQSLMAAGIAVSLYTSMIGYLFAGLGLFLAAWGTALPAPAKPGPKPRMDLRSLLFAFLGGTVGLITAIALVLGLIGPSAFFEGGPIAKILPVLTLVGTTAMLIAAVRVASEDHAEQARMVGLRSSAAVAMALGIGLIGLCGQLLGTSQAFRAVAVAPAESKSELLRYGLEVAAYVSTVGWSFALIPLFAGLASAMPHLGRANKWTAIGLVVAGFQVLLILAGMVYIGSASSSMWEGLL